jgi:hypothetical protein
MFGEIGLRTKKKARGFWASTTHSKSLGIALAPPSARPTARFYSTQLPSRTLCNSLKTKGARHGYPSQDRGGLFTASESRL